MIKLSNILNEIIVNNPLSFKPKLPGSDQIFFKWIKNNKIKILQHLSQTVDLEEEADIVDFNDVEIEDYNYFKEDINIEDEVKEIYPGGAIYALRSPDAEECRGLILTNLPEEVYENVGYSTPKNLNFSEKKDVFFDFEWC